MKITFCGANKTTTGSQHLLEINGRRILLDCGLYQGRREESYLRNRDFPFAPTDVDTVVLSHAHIDHSGNLPNLTRQGFKGNIYATPATRDLCAVMLADSARIQDSDLRWLRKKMKDHDERVEPLYNERDAELCVRQFVSFDYHRPTLVSDGVTATFFDAGHVLGAAQVLLDIDDRETGRKSRLLFSGDVGRGKNELLRDPEPTEGVDHVLMESTYGGVEHLDDISADDRFEEIVKTALRKGGKILIPSFALERTQQILSVLHRLYKQKRLPILPVYVDSPLAVGVTEIFRIHPECFNETVYESLFDRSNAFNFEQLRMIRAVAESKALNDREGPAIIIAASGMCESGRILHHLRSGISDAKNTVFFVGYCAENTLGWKIRRGDKRVRILGDEFDVRANITAIDSFSGHADNSDLLDYFARIEGPKKNVWLVHGEGERSSALKTELHETYPDKNILVPNTGDSVDV